MASMTAHQLAATLAAEIGRHPPGHRLASEHAMTKRFDVSRSTVRSALRELQDQYLIRRVQGNGTFVNRRIDYVISKSRRPSLHETIGAVGASCSTRLAGSEALLPAAPIAERLQQSPDQPARRLIRLTYIDDAISGYAEEWLPLDIAEHVEVGLRAIESLDQLLRGKKLDPVRAWCRIGLEIPAATIRDRLELDGPSQTWAVESLTRDKRSGRALIFSTTWTRPDLVRMVLELEE